MLWCGQLYLKKAEKDARAATSTSEAMQEEDLFSDKNYAIKNNYGLTNGAFKMVLCVNMELQMVSSEFMVFLLNVSKLLLFAAGKGKNRSTMRARHPRRVQAC